MGTREDRQNSEVTSALNRMLYLGATPTELATMFKVERRDLRAKLAGIPPSGKHDGVDVWRIREVASRLVAFDDSDAESLSRVLSMHHTALPPLLSEKYWAGQKNRLVVLKQTEALWDTQAVVELLSGVFKMLRLSITMIPDTLDRETQLTLQQREIIDKSVSTALEETRLRLVEDLQVRREYSQGKAYLGEGYQERTLESADDL